MQEHGCGNTCGTLSISRAVVATTSAAFCVVRGLYGGIPDSRQGGKSQIGCGSEEPEKGRVKPLSFGWSVRTGTKNLLGTSQPGPVAGECTPAAIDALLVRPDGPTIGTAALCAYSLKSCAAAEIWMGVCV